MQKTKQKPKVDTGYYTGTSLFARQVRESFFSRVCPKCYKQWSDLQSFMIETKVIDIETGIVTTRDPINEIDLVFYIPKQIREHINCGGQNYIDTEGIKKLIKKYDKHQRTS